MAGEKGRTMVFLRVNKSGRGGARSAAGGKGGKKKTREA